jgi:hypothetical protein
MRCLVKHDRFERKVTEDATKSPPTFVNCNNEL